MWHGQTPLLPNDLHSLQARTIERGKNGIIFEHLPGTSQIWIGMTNYHRGELKIRIVAVIDKPIFHLN